MSPYEKLANIAYHITVDPDYRAELEKQVETGSLADLDLTAGERQALVIYLKKSDRDQVKAGKEVEWEWWM